MRALLHCLCAFVVLAVFSCNDDVSEIGSTFFEGGALTLSTVDSTFLSVATVKYDSFPTSDATRFLIGYHVDEELGIISSAPFFQIGPNETLSIDKDLTSYTRVELRLVSDGYSYYDTLETISFSVHRLRQDIKIAPNESYLYNTSIFKFDPAPLGTFSYKPRPNVLVDTVVVQLSDAFGSDIIRLAQESAIEVESPGSFVDYFEGLVIVPDSISGPFVGFSTTSEVRVYYDDNSVSPSVERYVTLSSGTNLEFNRIISNRAGTTLSDIKAQRYSLGSADTDHKSYIQCGSGLALRVSMPFLRTMLVENPHLEIVNAVLSIPTTKNNVGRNLDLFQTLSMTGVDARNEITGTYQQTGLLYEDFYLERDTHYEVDVTAYVKIQLATEELNDNALIFTPDDATFRSTVGRLYVGDQRNDQPMKLTLTCLSYTK